MTSGRVRTRWSLQPSNDFPPKSSADRWKRWMFVPIAPSKTSTRWASAARYGLSAAAALTEFPERLKESASSTIRRVQKERPATQSARAGALAECLTWPQVALNRHEPVVPQQSNTAAPCLPRFSARCASRLPVRNSTAGPGDAGRFGGRFDAAELRIGYRAQ